jgi:hypothetical protein
MERESFIGGEKFEVDHTGVILLGETDINVLVKFKNTLSPTRLHDSISQKYQ